jgi:hypothetical protein
LNELLGANMPVQARNCNCGLCRTRAGTPGAHSDLLRAPCLKAAPLMTLQKCREELRGQTDRLKCDREVGQCVSDFYACNKRLLLQRLTPELSRATKWLRLE